MFVVSVPRPITLVSVLYVYVLVQNYMEVVATAEREPLTSHMDMRPPHEPRRTCVTVRQEHETSDRSAVSAERRRGPRRLGSPLAREPLSRSPGDRFIFKNGTRRAHRRFPAFRHY